MACRDGLARQVKGLFRAILIAREGWVDLLVYTLGGSQPQGLRAECVLRRVTPNPRDVTLIPAPVLHLD